MEPMVTEQEKRFSERLNKALDEIGVPPKGKGRQTTVAKMFGVSQKGARKWLEAEGMPEPKRLEQIAKKCGVNIEWLWGGRGPMRPKSIHEARDIEPGPDIGIILSIPIVGNTQAGPDKAWEELGYPAGYGEEYVDIPSKDVHAYALRIAGDSMEPRMREGEVVVVYPSEEPMPGDEVVVRTKAGEVMVKSLVYIRGGRVALDSVSNKYGRIVRHLDDIELMHPIAGVMRPQSIKHRKL